MKRKIVCRLLAVSLSAVMCTAAVPPGTAYAAGAASEEEGAYDNSEQMTDENTQGLVGSKNETVQAQTSDLAGSAEESETAQTQATDSTGNSTSTDVASSQTDDMSASEDGTESAPAQNSAALVGSADTDSARALKTWDFNDGTAQGWDYNSGWNYQYDGAASTSVTNENSMLKFNVDYSANSSSTWSQPVLTVYPSGLDISGADLLTFDFYYNPALLGSGSFATKVTVQNSSWSEDTSSYGNIDLSGAVDADGMDGYKKVTVKLSIPQAVTTSECACVALGIIGNMTAYKGAVYLDNISFSTDKEAEDTDVDSTVKIADGQDVAVSGTTLETKDSSGNAETTALPTDVTMVDADATASAKQLYSYLQAVGQSDSVIFGHQNDTRNKAGTLADTTANHSDVFDVTGSSAGLVGIDALSLTGDEYDADKCNKQYGTSFSNTAEGRVQAAAYAVNQDIAQGAIVTLSAHMPNFSVVKETGGDGDASYASYDFSGYSPNNLTGDVMNNLLPGGKYNAAFNAYLDMIADFAGQVDGAILFRPFHENTGSWFWWGAAFCDAATYKNVYRYTVTYLRDVKGVHNLLYVYSPGSEASTEDEYAARYPGDAYVDLVGFDMYHTDITENDSWFDSFKTELGLVDSFAGKHGKLMAVTETGMATSTPDTGSSQTALHATGNAQLDWYSKMLDATSASGASYIMTWANWGKNSAYYTPYVDSVNADGSLHGHEMLDAFIKYYNDPRSIFAANQKSALASLPDVAAKSAAEGADGYITSPVSGSRILEGLSITANVSGASGSDNVSFICKSKDGSVTLPGKMNGSSASAELTDADLASLGEGVGTIALVISGKTVDTISGLFNMKQAEQDPHEIDGFENYYGVDSLLTSSWSTNKATGSKITISLDKDHAMAGDYAMKFSYEEPSGGWAGATISRSVDWSDCNALQFYTVPDGNNQKVVIQITANGTVYEAYLQNYEAYRDSKDPMKVTIPFSEFCQRDTAGNPKGGLAGDASSVTSFGLWVNEIDGTEAASSGKVSGTIYYDGITAVKTDTASPSFEKIGGETPTAAPTATPAPTEAPTPTTTPKPTETPTPTAAPKPAEQKTQDMYRLYNPNSGEHFYTADASEKAHLVSVGWRYEGIAWTSPKKSDVPVYRLYNPNAGDHHYTTSKKERDWLMQKGWKYEGIGWYGSAKGASIYRLYNPNAKSGAHFFTRSKEEKDILVKKGWRYEGISWKVVK